MHGNVSANGTTGSTANATSTGRRVLPLCSHELAACAMPPCQGATGSEPDKAAMLIRLREAARRARGRDAIMRRPPDASQGEASQHRQQEAAFQSVDTAASRAPRCATPIKKVEPCSKPRYSRCSARVGKTPKQTLHGQAHAHWFELCDSSVSCRPEVRPERPRRSFSIRSRWPDPYDSCNQIIRQPQVDFRSQALHPRRQQ